jgi:hypothetical protein
LGDRVDEAGDERARLGRERVVVAAERDDPVRRRGAAGEGGDTVGVEPRACDDVLGMRRLAALEREAAAAVATIEPHDTAPEQDVAAVGLHFVGVRQRDATEVNDPSLRHVETANAGRVGLELADPVRLDVREPPEAVGEPAPLELRERRSVESSRAA